MIFHEYFKQIKVPDEIHAAIEQLQEEVKQAKFSVHMTQKTGMLKFLKKFKCLNIFGFNSSKYDLKCLAPYIYQYCALRNLKPNILKVCVLP